MKHTVVPAAVLSFWMLCGCGGQRHDPAAQAPPPASAPGGSGDPGAIVAAIESLAGLHERGILSDEEFAAKKTELLGRL